MSDDVTEDVYDPSADVSQAEDGTWTYQCPGGFSSRCGNQETGQPFVSSMWPTAEIAAARGQQHSDDHGGTPTPELHQFLREQGLVPHADGRHVVRKNGVA